MEKRDEVIFVRVTPSEKKKILEKMSGLHLYNGVN